jgi:RraA family protein
MTILRLSQPKRRASADKVEKLKAIPVANISDVMARLTAAGPRLRPMHAGGVLAGPAFTVKSRPGDNLLMHKALDMAQPGDVLVVDTGGDLTNAIAGEMMLNYGEKRGLAGVVINGAVRDIASISASSFPVFAAGVTHRGPYKNGPGEMNVAVAIDGMVIEPGDLIVGDDDGLVCVPYDKIDEVLAAATAKNDAETKQLAAILSGEYGPANRKWVDKAFADAGFEIVYE